MNYSSYQTEDFLTDDTFIAYCYREDKASIEKWEHILALCPELLQKANDAGDLCLLLGIRVTAAEKALSLKRLKNAIQMAGVHKPETKISSLRNYLLNWVALAAMLIIIIGTFAIYQTYLKHSGAALLSAVNDNNYRLIGQTKSGQRKFIALPDGSKAFLNGSTTLRIANDFNRQNRHLFLVGEAFFSVTKNKDKPFVVITKKTATTALGTSFKVDSYPEANVASVMLSTGKVKVESTQASLSITDITLYPGQKAALFTGHAQFIKTNFYADEMHNWMDRKLVFKNSDLNEICSKIKAIYGVVINPDLNPGNTVSFTGEFKEKDVTVVLDAIGFANHFTYMRRGNTVQLQF